MDRLNKLAKDFKNSLRRLEEAVSKAEKMKDTPEYQFYRDSAIQRFEFTFEIMWKTLKAFLEKEGVICRSPRMCIRELFSAGFITEDDARQLFQMLEDRNSTVHTYKEPIAERIFGSLPSHVNILRKITTVLSTSYQDA